MMTKPKMFFLAICLLALAPISVRAQTALGGGNALDRNLGVGTGGINPTQAVPNFRERNLIITGDVVGGRGFRGAVGYTAESDFRGRLGSNDLFNFRAQSALSSPQLFQNMRTYEQLRFGQELGLIEYRRAGSGEVAAVNAQNPMILAEAVNRLRLDRRLLDSSLSVTQHQLVEPRIVGTTQTREGQALNYNASSIRGIVVEPPGMAVGMIGLSSLDSARIREDIASGTPSKVVGAPFQTQFESLVQREAPETLAETGRVEVAPTTEHAKILDRIAERYSAQKNVDVKVQPELLKDLAQDYQSLRKQLTGRGTQPGSAGETDLPLPPGMTVRERDDHRIGDEATLTLPITPSVSPSTMPGMPDRSLPGMPPKTPDDSSKQPTTDYQAILRHGQRIEQLSTSASDRFNEIMSSAERKLREGDYLTAEQRFDRALRFVPGHPLATAGMANAQIGAGLYLSAALTLRNLFTSQPEMIDVRYAQELLPNQKRLDAAVLRLREQLAGESRDQGHYGLLLAYLGHQMNDRQLVSEGLNVLEGADPNNRLLPVIREVWLAPPINPASPPAEPAAEPLPPEPHK